MSSVKSYRAILMGFGSVSRSLAKLLDERGAALERDHGCAIRVVLVTDSAGAALDQSGLDPRRLLEAKAGAGRVDAYPGAGRPGLRGAEAIAAVEADLLLEATPTSVWTGEPGLTHIRAALSRGMHVVSANKGPLVVAYRELHALAAQRGVEFLNAATVAAPIPVLDIVRYALHGAVVKEIEAIPNATSNYILTLIASGRSLEEGIRGAQEAGVAETDPSLDIDGWDSAAKILIMANAAMGGDVQLDQISVQGIRDITAVQLREWQAGGQALKLLARARREPHGLVLSVAPTSLPLDHPLARLDGMAMGVLLHTDLLGDLFISVAGDDGGDGTAQSMLRDVINIGR